MSQLYEYLKLHELPVPAKFGFRKAKSTALAGESLVGHILNSFEPRKSTSVIYVIFPERLIVSHTLFFRLS